MLKTLQLPSKIRTRSFSTLLSNIIIFVCVYFVFLLFPKPVAAKIWINELMPDPEGEDEGNEWVELYNDSGTEINLDLYVLEDKNEDRNPILGTIVDYKVVYRNELSSFTLVNTGENTIKLYSPGDPLILVDTLIYNGSSKGKSWGRIPDGGSISSSKLDPTPGRANSLATSPPTPTATSSVTTATYKINDAKDGSGNVLEQVKIYIDDQYTGNYTDETYTFCEGCKCGSNNITCGFGSHSFKTEKSGYSNWSETRDITSGGSYEVSPVMSAETSSTPSPTPTSTFASTATPTPKPSVKATPSPTPISSESPEGDILGLSQDLATMESNPSPGSVGSTKKVSPLSVIFLMSGGLVVGLAGFSFLQSRGKEYNSNDEQQDSQDGTPVA